MRKFNEYFDSEELKGKDEISFLKGDTRKELKKISKKDKRYPKNLDFKDKVIRSLMYNNPFIEKFDILSGETVVGNKGIINITKEIKEYDNRFSAVSFIKIDITINKDKSFSVSSQCEVKVADTDKDMEYKKLFENLLNNNVNTLDELNNFFRNELFGFVRKWDKWSYSVTGKSILTNKEIEFKDDMVIDNLKGGDLELKEEPNFNPQFNSKSYNHLKGYNSFK